MPLEPSDYFRVIRTAYTIGLLPKITAISDQAFTEVLQELGIGTYEMLDCFDRADPAPLEKLLGRVPRFAVRQAARPTMQKLLSFALDRAFIRARVLTMVKNIYRPFFAAAMEEVLQPGEVSP